MNKDFENEIEDDLLPNYDFANMAWCAREVR